MAEADGGADTVVCGYHVIDRVGVVAFRQLRSN
jgi:hypothetical protein